MKWKNRGHEFDDRASRYINIFNERNDCIYIFGAGFHGENLALILERYHCFERYIDNDEGKQLEGALGKSVISFKDYLGQYKRVLSL